MGDILRQTNSILSKTNDTIDNVIYASQGLLCLPTIFSQFLLSKNLLATIGTIATQLVQSTLYTIERLVANTINRIIGAYSFEYRKALVAIDDILKSVAAVRQFIASFNSKVKSTYDFVRNQQNCTMMGAQLLGCLTKIVENKINSSIAQQYYNNTQQLVESITQDAIKDGGAISLIINKQLNYGKQIEDQLRYQ